MAEQIQGKITQIIGAVLDIKFPEGKLPKIYDAIHIAAPDGGVLTAEVAQHLGDDTLRWDRPMGWFVVPKRSQPVHRSPFRSEKRHFDVSSM